MKSNFITILLLWFCCSLLAQQNMDTLRLVDLEQITISESVSLLQSFNSADTLTNNTAGVTNSLQQQSNFYINTSSPNGLATLSLNGIAAKSIPVVWQNHNLNSIMNGIFDIQLLDDFLFNKTIIRYADTFEQAGWGGNAATVSVDDSANAKVQIQHQSGSFGRQKFGLAYNQQHQNIKNSTKAFYSKAENDFPILQSQLNKEKQNNNAIKSWGILNNTDFTFNEAHKFKINLWWQHTDREIATPLFTTNNKSTQIDSTFRLNLAWQYQPLKLKASVAWFNELNAYYNPLVNITGIHKTKALKSYVTHHKKIKDAFVLVNTISHNFYKANSTNFDKDEIRNSFLLKSVLLWQLKKIPVKLKADMVVDFTDNIFQPIRPGIYALYRPGNYLKISTQLSRHYSLPTFNDLYWSPGGNTQLLPEYGYVADAHITYKKNDKLFKFGLFTSSINNEIVWQPDTAITSFWWPKNVNKLNSKGFNLKAQKVFRLHHNNKLSTTLNYNYSDVRNLDVEAGTNLQLMYRPKHKGSIDFNYSFAKNIKLNYNHQITGKRFTSSDNLNSVPAFNTANFTAQYSINIDEAILNLEASVLNLFNSYYEITANRPMPGTHFLITTNLNFK